MLIVEQLIRMKKALPVQASAAPGTQAVQEQHELKFFTQLLREINKVIYTAMSMQVNHSDKATQSNFLQSLDSFFDFLISLEAASLIQKKDILNAFFELFECSPEHYLLSLFEMMERKLFSNEGTADEESKDSSNVGQRMVYAITANLGEKDLNLVINLCAKICKIIMRKLSVTHDTEFRGRVQKLIASVFPLTHPSGLNRAGNFNIKNATQFETLEEIKEQRERIKQEQGGMDQKLYRTFWNLQKYLSNPFNIFVSDKLDFEEYEEEEQQLHHNASGSDFVEIQQDDPMDKEEGEALDIEDAHTKLPLIDSNLGKVIQTVREILQQFHSQPLKNKDKEGAGIFRKYPKYLTRYSLLHLQFQDQLFRETFLVQILIFTQALKNPINVGQKKYFDKITELERRKLEGLEERVYSQLMDSQQATSTEVTGILLGKRKGATADHVKRILDNERFWASWKEGKCTNFERPSSEACKARKLQEQQRVPNRLMGQAGLLIQAKDGDMNDRRNGGEMRKYFRQPKEAVGGINIKPCFIPTITDHQYKFLCDQDPDQDIEDEYRNKHDQVFTWRFLRNIGTLDLANFLTRPETTDKTKQFLFNGDPEEQARLLLNLKRGDIQMYKRQEISFREPAGKGKDGMEEVVVAASAEVSAEKGAVEGGSAEPTEK
ncbi:hypothetical protein FGO68_gene5609 [Halteria grandinella]|uniref:Uncharacterized protein n=1 Tax=Halteria grandinella TaxID=5974 RepID=A0A8J8NXV7_HALGN|nr:hypothetical protein FGO68_gene5609 [Halteria grandinella]